MVPWGVVTVGSPLSIPSITLVEKEIVTKQINQNKSKIRMVAVGTPLSIASITLVDKPRPARRGDMSTIDWSISVEILAT